jgi:hypothetical protein
MTKPFNIHDWQAKQKKQLLNEGVWEVGSKQDIQEFISKLKQLQNVYYNVVGSDEVQNGLDTALQAAEELMSQDTTSGGGVNEHHGDEDFPGKDLSAWDLLDKLKKHPDLYGKVEDFMKSMDSEPSKSNDSMWTSTSTADTSTDTVEPEEEKEKPNWRNYRENTTGTGASVTGGPGMGYFGKKKNK